jgi:hypothetical protein
MMTQEPQPSAPPPPPLPPSATATPVVPYAGIASPPPQSGRETYNIVSDTVVGVNVRWKDNVFQAVFIVVCLVIGVAVGSYIARDLLMGVMIGAVAGLIFGVISSGIVLMIYRGVRHLRGKHD